MKIRQPVQSVDKSQVFRWTYVFVPLLIFIPLHIFHAFEYDNHKCVEWNSQVSGREPGKTDQVGGVQDTGSLKFELPFIGVVVAVSPLVVSLAA